MWRRGYRRRLAWLGAWGEGRGVFRLGLLWFALARRMKMRMRRTSEVNEIEV